MLQSLSRKNNSNKTLFNLVEFLVYRIKKDLEHLTVPNPGSPPPCGASPWTWSPHPCLLHHRPCTMSHTLMLRRRRCRTPNRPTLMHVKSMHELFSLLTHICNIYDAISMFYIDFWVFTNDPIYFGCNYEDRKPCFVYF
jgi:hypothetical protein